MATYEIDPIGWVASTLTAIDDAPPQGDEGAPDATIVLRPELRTALRGLQAGDRLLVLTWLDRADRTTLEVHPRGDPARPRQGVFSTRAPDRPNPIGLHEVQLLAIDDTELRVGPLEALDGTPVIDIKPVLGPVAHR
jgi:tRNA-Thr(GGU) m(6)t(6)A37 methyltransferase TsaA